MPFNDRRTTVFALRRHMAAFVAARDWQKFHRPKNLSMSLAIEAAELMEHFQWLTHAQADRLLKNSAARKEIADEMADVLSLPEGTVKSRLYHARQQLRQLMEKDYGTD